MKTYRWFLVMLIVGVLSLVSFSITAAFSDNTAKAGHDHETGKQNEAKIKTAIAKLPRSDRSAVAAQRYCPMMDTVELGAMGKPVKVVIDGKSGRLRDTG